MSIGRLYTVSAPTDTNTGAQTELRLTSLATTMLFLERAAISQGTQDTSEQMDASISKWSIPATGGDVLVAVPLAPNDVAASFTAGVEGAIALVTGTGTQTIFYQQGFNMLSGFLWTPANDDEVIMADLSDVLELALESTAAGTTIWSVAATVRELGT